MNECIRYNYILSRIRINEILGHSMHNGFISKKINENIKERKRSWGPFRIYQLINTGCPALFEWNWAGLAVLISW
jgi:hypothetical protein